MGRFDIGHLIEIRYPVDFAEREPLRVPTILSAGPNALFRAHRLESDGWGRTVRLDNMQSGAPEAVHGEYTIQNGHQLHYLGLLGVQSVFDRWKDLLDFNKTHL